MPLSNAQTTTFFTHASQMAIPAATVAALNNEGINTVDDLEQILPEDIERISKIFRSQDPIVVFSVTSQKRLTNACHMVRYYNAVNRPLTAQNMKWNPTGKNFELQWKALNQVKDEDDPDVPKISKSLPIMKWKDAFVDMLGRVVGIFLTLFDQTGHYCSCSSSTTSTCGWRRSWCLSSLRGCWIDR